VQRDSTGIRARFADREHQVEVIAIEPGSLLLIIDGHRQRVDIVHQGHDRLVSVGGEVYRFESESGVASAHEVGNVAAPEIVAPMPGKVTQVLVQLGDSVAAGDGLLILEAMKMENRLVAEAAGEVGEVRVKPGDMVNGGQVLIVLHYKD
jgi:biotin carboxyl carrier protein